MVSIRKQVKAVCGAGSKAINKTKPTVEHYFNNTAIHGCRHIMSEVVHRRWIWVLVLVGCSLAFGTHMVKLIRLYVAYPIQVDIREELNHGILPEVVICSARRWSDTQIEAHRELQGSDFFGRLRKEMTRYLESFNVSDLNRVVGDALVVNLPNASYYGVQPWDLIVACHLNGDHCDYRNFELVHSDAFLNCYRLKVPFDQRRVTITDYWRGLHLVLNIEDTRWDEHPRQVGLFGSRGAAVIIRPHKSGIGEAKIEKDAIWIPTGADAKISFSYSKVSRIETPIRRCRKRLHVYNAAVNQECSVNYSMSMCIDLELNRLAHKKCGCLLAWLPVPASLRNAATCRRLSVELMDNSSHNETKYSFSHQDCGNKVQEEILDSGVLNDIVCPPECEEVSISVSHSHVNLPNDPVYLDYYQELLTSQMQTVQKDGIKRTSLRKLVNKDGKMASPHIVQNNLLRVMIHLGSQTTLHRFETRAFPFERFASEAGGMFSFWLGGSIVALLEIIEVLSRIVAILIHTFKPSNKVQEDDEPGSPISMCSVYVDDNRMQNDSITSFTEIG